MKTLKFAFNTFLLISMFASFVLASNVDMNSKKDCDVKKNNLKKFTTYTHSFKESICAMAMGGKYEFCKGLKDVAWYKDRNNSMSDANNKAGQAMFILHTKVGTTMATQVCPGVFLATDHGTFRKGNGRNPHKQRVRIYPFPRTFKKRFGDKELGFKFISPRLDGKDNAHYDPLMDFVFIKSNPKKLKTYARKRKMKYSSNNFITPVKASTKDLVRYSNDKDIDVHLYRGKTRYKKDRSDPEFPDFNRDTWERGPKGLAKVYKKPQRVNVRCELDIDGTDGLVESSCPAEDSVSGSPYVANIKGKKEKYLVGMHTLGAESKMKSFKRDAGANTFLGSKMFCSYYEKACGSKYKCKDLSDLLTQQKTITEHQSYIIIRTKHANDRVYIDNDYIGPSSPVKHAVVSGEHTIRIEKDGYKSKEFSITVNKNETKTSKDHKLKRK